MKIAARQRERERERIRAEGSRGVHKDEARCPWLDTVKTAEGEKVKGREEN